MTDPNLRLRIFAGPNGSGKSTIIEAVKNFRVNTIPVDFGIYINADDIAKALRDNVFSFSDYQTQVTLDEFKNVASSSGLINAEFTFSNFISSFSLDLGHITLLQPKADERLSQIIADFLRKKLLKEKKKFSFETVFSHKSKIDIMREAAEAGYKVYLYFVSTESPEINKYRVEVRKKKGGHGVPPDKIFSRYTRSLDLLFEAAQYAYSAYFFDNSQDGQDFRLFAHFKNVKGEKQWDLINPPDVPNWFIKYYSNKVQQK